MDWEWRNIDNAIIPFGIKMVGKKLHFNVLIVVAGKCTRYEPHRHATLFYSEKRVDSFLSSVFTSYSKQYMDKCGTMCIEDAFSML